MQQTDFSFEVLIHDDASTDGTRQVIEEYQAKHPDIVKPIYESENQWQKGRRGSVLFNFPRAQGTYIALCEGDDYWTDPNKLQMQVDYMESHPECAVSFHGVAVRYDDSDREDDVYPHADDRSLLTRDHLFATNFIGTNSVMYRKLDYENLSTEVMPTDLYLHLFHARFGDIHFIDRVMSVYRKHAGGIWWDEDVESWDRRWLTYGIQMVNLWAELTDLYQGHEAELALIDRQSDEVISALIGVDRKHRRGLTLQVMTTYPGITQEFLYRQSREFEETKAALGAEQNRWRIIQASRVWRTREAAAKLARRLKFAGRTPAP